MTIPSAMGARSDGTPVPPRHGPCERYAVLRARAAPGLRLRPSERPRLRWACSTGRSGDRPRRGRAGGRGKCGQARIQHNRALPAVPRSQLSCSSRGTARARCASLTCAVHATVGYVLRPGRLPHAACAKKRRAPCVLKTNQRGHALARVAARQKRKATTPRPPRGGRGPARVGGSRGAALPLPSAPEGLPYSRLEPLKNVPDREQNHVAPGGAARATSRARRARSSPAGAALAHKARLC
jgi:hypothetical protein